MDTAVVKGDIVFFALFEEMFETVGSVKALDAMA